jgi:hypothetical protein
MTEQDIVRLAEEADLWLHSDRKYEAVEKFAVLVAAAEREECAKLCEMVADDEFYWGRQYAEMLRARGQG